MLMLMHFLIAVQLPVDSMVFMGYYFHQDGGEIKEFANTRHCFYF